MLNSESEQQLLTFKSSLREGFTDRVLELVVKGYIAMCKEGYFDRTWDEEKFSAVLVGCIENFCPKFAKLTYQVWHVQREHYKDNAQIRKGEGNPRAVPRIDIVIFNWTRIGARVRKFPFAITASPDFHPPTS